MTKLKSHALRRSALCNGTVFNVFVYSKSRVTLRVKTVQVMEFSQ